MLESELAWHLADEYGDRFTAADRSTVFVHIGAGDFAEAISFLLEVCARQRISLTAEALASLTEWLRVYDRSADFGAAVARVAG
ncbi:hypothetical protein A4X20_05450 [Mycolicibacterium iranicum]|uniref:Tryptophanase n=2 Tax=Mycolicibacterium iranicum TaxID=912594 RepID=A0A178LY16_MYCIR|nr:hypothetical protein A4X20_05450 [Mycolicibacterium iranicum]